MRTDPHQMAIMDALAERIRTIRSEGMATLALTHEARYRQMPPRCAGCRAPLSEEEIAWAQSPDNPAKRSPGDTRCFVCLDEHALLHAAELRIYTQQPLFIDGVMLT